MSHSATDLKHKLVYLAGPMSGIPEYNFPAFQEAAAALRLKGINVWSPAEKDIAEGFNPATDQAQHISEYMKVDLPALLDTHGVVVLPGWQDSVGARMEVHVAVGCGKPVYSYPDLEPVDVQVIIGRRTQTHIIPDGNGGMVTLGHPDDPREILVDSWAPDPYPTDYFSPPSDELRRQMELDGVPGGILRERSIMDDLKAIHVADSRRIVTNEVTGGQKETRPARFDLLPWDQLWKVAELYAYGATKYEDRNWERGYAFSLSIAALHRHLAKFVQGENDDAESGCPHLASVVFHALALMRFVDGTQLDVLPRELDDRPVGAGVDARKDGEGIAPLR